jgi:hypothetical protein
MPSNIKNEQNLKRNKIRYKIIFRVRHNSKHHKKGPMKYRCPFEEMTRLDQREEIKLRPISGSVTNRDKQDDEQIDWK